MALHTWRWRRGCELAALPSPPSRCMLCHHHCLPVPPLTFLSPCECSAAAAAAATGSGPPRPSSRSPSGHCSPPQPATARMTGSASPRVSGRVRLLLLLLLAWLPAVAVAVVLVMMAASPLGVPPVGAPSAVRLAGHQSVAARISSLCGTGEPPPVLLTPPNSCPLSPFPLSSALQRGVPPPSTCTWSGWRGASPASQTR
jgi:hypothetical protein